MWIFTEVGFFSVVQSKDPTKVMIRSRDPKDLELLRKIYMPDLSETLMSPTRDYPCRAFATKEQFALGMARIAASIDYDNFKNHVHDLDPERVSYYSRVWGVMADSSPDGRRPYGGAYTSRSSVVGQGSLFSGPKSAEESADTFFLERDAGFAVAERAVADNESSRDSVDDDTIAQFLHDWRSVHGGGSDSEEEDDESQVGTYAR